MNQEHARSRDDGSAERIVPLLSPEGEVLELVANGRPLDEVLEALVRSIESRCVGAMASVLLLSDDGRRLEHGAASGLPRDYVGAVDGIRIGPRVGSCGTAAYRGEPVEVRDTLIDPLWADYRELVQRHGLRACWSYPIFSSNHKVMGTLALYSRQPGKPTSAERSYIDSAVHLAGIVVEQSVTRRKRREADQRLLRQKAVLVELAHSSQLELADFGAFARLATEAASETIVCERAGIWLFSKDRTSLCLKDLYELSPDRHSSDIELDASSYPRYFAALERGRAVVAHDARNDPDTSEFRKAYLVPHGITSMLDVPVRRSGQLHGVVCFEHVGPARTWAGDEQEFASSIGDFVALVLESEDRKRAEQAYRSAQEELLRQHWQARKQIEYELDEARENLVRSTRLAAVGQISASIAHELRNPLGAAKNAAYLLAHGRDLTPEKRDEYTRIVDSEIRRSDRIVENLLELTRAKKPEPSSVELVPLVREAWAYAGELSDAELRVKIGDESLRVSADPDLMRQVLGNLFDNAVRAQEGGGLVLVDAVCEGDGVRISIEDEGPGVAPAERSRIFEPLFTTRPEGTGLGLAISKQIVEGHGGSLEVADRSGGGARFEIVLPRRTEGDAV